MGEGDVLNFMRDNMKQDIRLPEGFVFVGMTNIDENIKEREYGIINTSEFDTFKND